LNVGQLLNRCNDINILVVSVVNIVNVHVHNCLNVLAEINSVISDIVGLPWLVALRVPTLISFIREVIGNVRFEVPKLLIFDNCFGSTLVLAKIRGEFDNSVVSLIIVSGGLPINFRF